MTLWIVFSGLTAVAAAAMAIPLARRMRTPSSERDRSVAVWRAQIAEIDREVEQGTIGQDQADLARAEVERRIVAAAREQTPEARIGPEGHRTFALAIVCGWLVAGTIALYAVVGRPDLQSAPFQPSAAAAVVSATPASPEKGLAAGNVDDMIGSLAARLEERPDDANGWRMLGWSYFNTQNYGKAADAYAKAVEIEGDDPDLLSLYGEALVRAAGGLVTQDALTVFGKAAALNPDDARARFFQGMALEQAGDPAAAIDAWEALLKSAPEGADWVPGVEERVRELAAASNIDLAGRLSVPPRTAAALLPPQTAGAAPTADQVGAMMAMAPDERQAMIRGMVDRLEARLEADPGDPDGWIRLMRSRLVLGEETAASAAFDRARLAFADAPDPLGRIVAAANEMGLTRN